jgi:2-octaprenyl-6-methoxyphenol hydroxylase
MNQNVNSEGIGQPAFDVLVVGGGPAGSAAAMAFARAGRSVALLAAERPRADGRTVALMQPALRFLEDLDAWEKLEACSAPLERLVIVDDTGSLFRPPPTTFIAREIDLDHFGKNIEASILADGLWSAAGTDERVVRMTGRAVAVSNDGPLARVATDNGTVITARLLVAADGRRSLLREAAGIGVREWSYPQAAVTAILAHERSHQETSTEFHTRSGPFTLVPLPGRRSSLVWLTEPRNAERLIAEGEAEFALTVERQARSMLGRMRLDGPRGSTPMTGISVGSFGRNRIALIGEAAHVFPPIGAQGLNLGFSDVRALLAAAAPFDDPGCQEALSAYDADRSGEVGARTTFVDVLNRSLLTALLPVDLARGVGLLALGSIGSLRRMAMKRGLGAGDYGNRS